MSTMDSGATFDGRDAGPRYRVSTFLNDRPQRLNQPIEDPFIRTTVGLSWRAVLRCILDRRCEVTVRVNGMDRDAVEDVLLLDNNYRGLPGSRRRRECDERLNAALRRHAT